MLSFDFETGLYEVFVSYSRASGRSTAVEYVIKSMDGVKRDVVTVDQACAFSPLSID